MLTEDPHLDRVHFEAGFTRELAHSERTRARVLGAVCVLLALTASGILLFAGQLDPAGTLGAGEWRLPLFGGMSLGFYELMVARWLAAVEARGETPWERWRYLNLGIELTGASGLLALVMVFVDPLLGLYGPPGMMYLLFIFLTALNLKPRLCLFAGVLSALEFLGLAAFFWSDLALRHPELGPLGHPVTVALRMMGLLGAGAFTAMVAQEIKERVLATITAAEERQEVLALFGQQVSPEVVNKLLEQPSGLSTETRHVCMMFMDIRGFTTFSEGREPEEVVAFLNTLFDAMIATVNEHQGIINKFLGDGFMAIFGAPVSDGQDSVNAVAASRELLRQVSQMVERSEIPATRIGIGLHAGDAVTGNVGSHLRREYTVIGDVVNTASRIEGLNKRFDSQLLVSDAVYRALNEVQPGAVQLEPVAVKGRAEPVTIWKLA